MKILKYSRNNLANVSFGRSERNNKGKWFDRLDDSFFFRPHIDINTELESFEKPISIKLKDGNTQELQISIMSIVIQNNTQFWSKIGNNCYYKIYLSKDSQGFTEDNELCWKTKLPDECKTDKIENFLESYRKELDEFVKTKIHLPRGIDKELLFLLAIPSSEGIYLISVKKGESLDDTGKSIGVYEYIEFTPLKITEYNVNLVFHSDEYKEPKGSNYKLNIKDWNNIEFIKTKS